MRGWRVLREPAVPILLLTCVVHAVRRNLFDLLLFAGTAVVIVVDARRKPAPEIAGSHPRGPAPRWRIWAFVLGFAVLVAPLPRDGAGIKTVLTIVGVALLAVLLVRPGEAAAEPARPAGAVRGWPVWAILGVLACLWELTSFAIQQADPAADAAHPTMSDLIGPLLADWPGRVVFLALWAAGGIWLLHRLVGDGHEVGDRHEVGDWGEAGDRGEVGDRHRHPEQVPGAERREPGSGRYPHHAGSGGKP